MNCSYISIDLDSSIKLYSLMTYIPFFFLGTTLNIFALWVFCCRLPKWTETSVFLVNLMVADILISLTHPFRIYSILHKWNLSHALCRTLTIFYFVNTYISIFTISAIAFDRYFAITYPLKYKGCMSPKKACIICGFFWTVFISTGILRLLNPIMKENFNSCFIKVYIQPNPMNLVFAVIGFFLPLVFICFCSGKVMKNLCIKVPLSSEQHNAFRKAINIIISNLVVFVVCFFPLHVGYIVRHVAESSHASCDTLQSIKVFMHVATIFANANCVLDTVCYYFAASEFRNSLCMQKEIFPKRSSFCCP